MWGDFLKNRTAQRLSVYRGFMIKVRKILYKIYHKEKHGETENVPIFIEKVTSLKTLGPSGIVITMVS